MLLSLSRLVHGSPSYPSFPAFYFWLSSTLSRWIGCMFRSSNLLAAKRERERERGRKHYIHGHSLYPEIPAILFLLTRRSLISSSLSDYVFICVDVVPPNYQYALWREIPPYTILPVHHYYLLQSVSPINQPVARISLTPTPALQVPAY
jgi:hypothetical protein